MPRPPTPSVITLVSEYTAISCECRAGIILHSYEWSVDVLIVGFPTRVSPNPKTWVYRGLKPDSKV